MLKPHVHLNIYHRVFFYQSGARFMRGGGDRGRPLAPPCLPPPFSKQRAQSTCKIFLFFLPSLFSPLWACWGLSLLAPLFSLLLTHPPPAPSLLPCPPLIYKIKSPDSILHYSQMFNTFQVIAPPPKKKKQKQKQKNKHDFFSDLTTQPVYIYVREILRHCFNNRTHLLVWLLRCPSWT